jgi:hypothetical protein
MSPSYFEQGIPDKEDGDRVGSGRIVLEGFYVDEPGKSVNFRMKRSHS